MGRWIILALLLSGCGAPCAQVKATRCLGQVVEVCGNNGRWQRVMDCSQVRAIRTGAPTSWTCGQTTAGNTCAPGGGR